MNPNLKKETVYAFIDSQNLHLGINRDVVNKKGKKLYSGRSLDYKKFLSYLRNKYGVSGAYIFIGFLPQHNQLYANLQQIGYTLIFKTVASYTDEEGNDIPKGNVDTDMVLYSAAILFKEYDKGIFVSGDGDFLSLYDYMDNQQKLGLILVPNRHRYSQLLNQFRSKIRFVSDINPLLKTNKKD